MIIKDALNERTLTSMWNSFDWSAAESELLAMQQNLTNAVLRNDDIQRIYWQKQIVHSLSAKMLAVRHVCSGICSPGIDGKRWREIHERMSAALSLNEEDYHAKPMRRIIIQPKQGKERPINVPVIYDRAMQVLHAYSLDPISEVGAEPNSFAFRKGRSLMDVHAFIIDAISAPYAPEYIILTDVKSCYESISHEWLLENIPMNKYVLMEFLRAGYVFAGELYPTDDLGISLGANISHILSNMTLDNMQEAIYNDTITKRKDYQNGYLIRFADDLLITARSEKDAEKIISSVNNFLAIRGLALSPEKTSIVSVQDGFDFLSRTYIKKNNVVTSFPSAAAVKKMEASLQELILTHKGSQKALIEALNKKLTGWASYHKITDAMDVFRHMDVVVKTFLLQLCESKHPRLPRKKIIEKYFFKDSRSEYVYALPEKRDAQVMKLANTVLIRHQRIDTSANPYLDMDYYEHRSKHRDINNVTGKYKAVWTRQKGLCYYCHQTILIDQQKHIVAMNPNAALTPHNMAYIHERCLLDDIEFHKVDKGVFSNFDLIEVLRNMEGETVRHRKILKYDPLKEYFQKRTDPVFTLTFREIEKILGSPLCKTALTYPQYWSRKDRVGSLSETWWANGYKLKHLDMEKKYAVFKRIEGDMTPLKIPDIFINGKIPIDAAAELNNFFAYVKKKYGI